MSNMHHCRFHNTLASLLECQDSMSINEVLSEEEEEAKADLISLCVEITEEYGE